MTGERSISDVLQEILRNLQEIVRSEVRLARAEIRADVAQAAASGMWIAAGIVAAFSTWMLLVWTAVYALATIMPTWAATLLMALGIGAVAGIAIPIGIRKLRRIRPMPERTVETLKENVEWMKQSTK